MLSSGWNVDSWSTIEGRHLVLAYVAIFLIQSGYFGWMAIEWLKLSRAKKSNEAG